MLFVGAFWVRNLLVFLLIILVPPPSKKIKLHDCHATREGLSKTYQIMYDLHPGFSNAF